MKIKKCKCLFFSPTGTTKKVVNEIAAGIGINEKENIDFTPLAVRDQNRISFKKDELGIIGVPVYSGRIPILAEEFIHRLKAEGSPAVIVAVYGNRAYDDALKELKDCCEKVGFRTIAGAAFIGEHSFSSAVTPIAAKRPDKEDLRKAKSFGKEIAEKIELIEKGHNISGLFVPGDFPYKERKPASKIAPTTNKELCSLCSRCIDVCPTDAITKDESGIKTDPSKCIICYACIKICPEDAREMDNDSLKQVAERLYNTCQKRKEAEFF